MSARRPRTPLAARFELVPPIAPDGVQQPLGRATTAPGRPRPRLAPALARLARLAGLDRDRRLIFARPASRGGRWR